MKKAKYFYYYEYLKYLEFIDKCKTKIYKNEVTHKHHIIPSHIENNNNTINLNLNDHIKAHILFSKIWPENTYEKAANIWSAQILNRENDYNILNEIKENRSGNLNPFYGKKHTDKSRKKISKKSLIQLDNGWDYKKRYGERELEEKKKRSTGVKKSWAEYSKKERNKRIKNTAISLKNSIKNKRGLNPAAKKCEYNGIIYECLQDLIEKTGLSRYKLIKSNKFKII